MKQNPLTIWLHEYLDHQPNAKPINGWRHLVDVATSFPRVLDWLSGFDHLRSEVIYRRSVETPEQRLCKASFDKQFTRIRQVRKLSIDVRSMV